jgi:hypothetical protein
MSIKTFRIRGSGNVYILLIIIIPNCCKYAIGKIKNITSWSIRCTKEVFLLGNLLYDEQPIVVDRTLAKLLGLNEAIILQQIHYWLKINEKKKQNFYDGRYWTYNSAKEWQENDFAFWSLKTIQRTFSNLEDQNILIVGNYNPDRRDRTKWYSIDYDKLDLLVKEYQDQMQKDKMTKCNSSECPNANSQVDLMHEDNLGQPLPETTTEISTETILSDQMEFDSIDDLIKHYSAKYNLPYERVLQVYDRIIPQYKAGNVKKFTPYFEAALEQEKRDYERNKFIDRG